MFANVAFTVKYVAVSAVEDRKQASDPNPTIVMDKLTNQNLAWSVSSL